jgi:hypothetical protein
VYLARRITVVESKDELEFGTTVEDTSAWMIDDKAFAQRLQSKRLYIVTDESNYDRLRAEFHTRVYELAKYGRHVLVTNREPKP